MDFKWDDIHLNIHNVDEKDLQALKIFYQNCKRIANENNNNVELATLNPDKWMENFIPILLSSVDYVSLGPMIGIYYFEDGRLWTKSLETTWKDFNTFNEMVEFFTKERFSELVLFSICKYVNLDNLKESWQIRFGEISNKEIERDKKIKYLTDGIDNN